MTLTNKEREVLAKMLRQEIDSYKWQMKRSYTIDDIEGEIAILNNKLAEAYQEAEVHAKALDELEEALYKVTNND